MTFRFLFSRTLLCLIGVFLASACSSALTQTPFIPPTNQAPFIEPTLIINPTRETAPTRQVIVLPTLAPTLDQSNCVNNLKFVEDVTIPDNSYVPYGSSIDKQWRVENTGTCNWNADYRLKHIGGAVLGAPEEIALYPARSNTQVTLQITFTAPFADGVYESAWQAYDPNGVPFGDPIYMRILVSP